MENPSLGLVEKSVLEEQRLIFGEEHKRNARRDLDLNREATNEELLLHWYKWHQGTGPTPHAATFALLWGQQIG